MANTKGTIPNKTSSRTNATDRSPSDQPATVVTTGFDSDDETLIARAGRTIKERPYTSAAIATGAVTVVAAAAAAGAFLVARREKGFKEASGELSDKVKDSLAGASETIKEGLASATTSVKDLGQRGADYLTGDGSASTTETRTQQQIAEEALTLKEMGAAKNPLDDLSALEIKTGAVAY